METLITLEDFHQYVLFHLIDVEIPDYVQYIAIDPANYRMEATIYGYIRTPVIAPDLSQWGAECDGHIAGGLRVTITIPDNISWKDCKWKL